MIHPTLNNDSLPISGAINDILIKYTSALAEIERLQRQHDDDKAIITMVRMDNNRLSSANIPVSNAHTNTEKLYDHE